MKNQMLSIFIIGLCAAKRAGASRLYSAATCQNSKNSKVFIISLIDGN